MNSFKYRFRELKEEHSLTQSKIAEDLGLTPQAVSYIANGREPGYEVLTRIASYFSVTVDYLIGASDIRNYDTFIEQADELTLMILRYDKYQLGHWLKELLLEVKFNEVEDEYLPILSKLLENLEEQLVEVFEVKTSVETANRALNILDKLPENSLKPIESNDYNKYNSNKYNNFPDPFLISSVIDSILELNRFLQKHMNEYIENYNK